MKKEFIKVANKEYRFEFGENWKEFLEKLNHERIAISQSSILKMLGVSSLSNKSFIDIGSGSGLSSLAAKNLGARVTSFDFDQSSVWCTSELKNRFYKGDKSWEVMQGSVLDKKFLNRFGKFDIVYSWGVLHHTGKMWFAIDNCLCLVKKKGVFFLAIYNDQGIKSRFWWIIKWFYHKLPKILQKPFAYSVDFFVKFLILFKYTLKFRPMIILGPMFNYKQARGMSMLSDIIDWYGGFPYEFANFEYLVDYIQNKGFILQKGVKASSLGCHELVFKKL